MMEFKESEGKIMTTIDTETYNNDISSLLNKYNLQDNTKLIFAEPNIREYCKLNSIIVNNKIIYDEIPETRVAINLRIKNPDSYMIIIKKHISFIEKISALGAIIVRGNEGILDHLESDRLFVIHTILHEICEILHHDSPISEGDCDRWAFKELCL